MLYDPKSDRGKQLFQRTKDAMAENQQLGAQLTAGRAAELEQQLADVRATEDALIAQGAEMEKVSVVLGGRRSSLEYRS